MLKPGDARKHIEGQKRPDWARECAAALKKLPGARAWMRVNFLRGEVKGSFSQAELKESETFNVAAYTDKQRAQLFETLFPKLAPSLERAWQQSSNWPYCAVVGRPCTFRAPANHEATSRGRNRWISAVIDELEGLNPDPLWLATWGAHIGYMGIGESARVLSTLMDTGDRQGEEIFDILKRSANNQHEIGGMGRHVIRALQCSGRPDAWEYVEKMLVAAQAQEGLRQWILEMCVEGHSECFGRTLRIVVDERMARFASVVRAVDVWFGFLWDSASAGHVHSILERAAAMLKEESARTAALEGTDAESQYLALWCEAHHDATRAVAKAEKLLSDTSPAKRMVGVHTLGRTALAQSATAICKTLDDADLRVAARAFDAVSEIGPLLLQSEPLFRHMERLLERVKGKEAKLEPQLAPWGPKTLPTSNIAFMMLSCCPMEHAALVQPHLPRFDVDARIRGAFLLAGIQITYAHEKFDASSVIPLPPHRRAVLIQLLGDPAARVRERVSELLDLEKVSPEEVAMHESLCDRTAGDIRARAIARLGSQPDRDALVSAERLLGGKEPSIQAGLGVLRLLAESKRSEAAVGKIARAFSSSCESHSTDVRVLLAAILDADAGGAPMANDAFGLAKAFTPRPLPALRKIAASELTPAALNCLQSLDALVEANKTRAVHPIREGEEGSAAAEGEGQPLGALQYLYGVSPARRRTLEQERRLCPVGDILESWLAARSPGSRDEDGLELVRAWIYVDLYHKTPAPKRSILSLLKAAPPRLKYLSGVRLLLQWAMRLTAVDGGDLMLDQVEGALQRKDVMRPGDDEYIGKDKQPGSSAYQALENYDDCTACWLNESKIDRLRRLEGLRRAARALMAAEGRICRWGAEFESALNEFVPLWEAGEIGDDEFLVHLAHPSTSELTKRVSVDGFVRLMSLRKPNKGAQRTDIALTPRMDALLEKLRVRVLEIELDRGDAATAATPHASGMDPSGGIDAAIGAMSRMGKLKLARGFLYGASGKAASFSQIIAHSRPGAADTPDAFAAAARAERLSEQRLVELAMYQPLWCQHVQHTIGWDGLEEAVLWLRTHTKQRKQQYWMDPEKAAWESRAAELTPISQESLADGAVDRAWLLCCFAKLGRERWEMLYDAATYASDGAGHTRARLFADAILGDISEREITERIATKRHQDSARALGLLAVADGAQGREQVLSRFKVLQEMRRTSRAHGGSMLQASEKRAIEIGMENLAWSAGYPDPNRLQWAMEIEQFGDLANGPVTVVSGSTSVTLSVDEEGVPSVQAAKAGRALKSIPAALKKQDEIAALLLRSTELRRQGTRARHSLEQAMCRGDQFTGAELAELFRHPLLGSMLARLVMIGTTPGGAPLLGYPDKQGKAIRSVNHELEPLGATDSLRVAHPLDLLATRDWHLWQSECFKSERIQPFKQVFREVYPLIAAESDAKHSTRYAGQQINPRQGLALFGSRGWVARPEEGVQRTFHQEGITASVLFEEGFYTPAEIDGLTLAGVEFRKSGAREAMRLREVPSRLLSEVLRDMDLVVSVAHRGGVDPEASHSTVEMRTALVRELSSLLALANVRIEGVRALIKGELAEYSVHLGSGTMHQIPGGMILVVPVHSQHRGKLFLPFADDDPKTAEIVSKVVLFARDRSIKDPSILAQLRNR